MSVESMLDKIVDKLISMENNFDKQLKELKGEMSELKSEVRKNSIKIETVETKVDTIAEVVEANRQQNERQHAEIMSVLGERIDVIETTIKRVK